MPIVFSLIGLAVCAVCLLFLTKTGRALWQKKLNEALDEDRRNLSDDESVG